MTSLFLCVGLIAGTFGFMYVMKKKLGTQLAHLRASELAARMGMQVTEGNPEFNLGCHSVLPSAQALGSAKGFLGQMAKSSFGGKLGEFKLRMAGQPYGAHSELVLYCKEELEKGYGEDTITTTHDLRLTVHARSAVAPFELALRKEMTGLEIKRGDRRMPPQSFHDAALDQRYVIESTDPALPSRIATALAALPPHLLYVRIVGSGDQVSFVMTPGSVNAVAASLEQLLHVLASVTAVIEGRPMPGMLAA